VNGLSGSAMGGGALFDANDNLQFMFTFTAVSFEPNGVLVNVNGPMSQNVHVDTRSSQQGGGSMGLGLTVNDAAGTYKLLGWVAGSATSWDWQFQGGSGVQLLGQLSGSHAFLYGASDFQDGGAHAQAYQSGVGGRVDAAAQKVVTIQNNFYGVYYDANFHIACAVVICVSAPSTSLLTATDPSGNTQPCGPNTGVISVTFCAYTGAGPGTYSFGLNGADASETAVTPFECIAVCAGVIPWQDAIILGGADASLPQ
jgi:hypothetical protein